MGPADPVGLADLVDQEDQVDQAVEDRVDRAAQVDFTPISGNYPGSKTVCRRWLR